MVLMQLCFHQPGGGFAAGKNGLGEALLHQHDYFFLSLFIFQRLTFYRFLTGGEALQRASSIPMSLCGSTPPVWPHFWSLGFCYQHPRCWAWCCRPSASSSPHKSLTTPERSLKRARKSAITSCPRGADPVGKARKYLGIAT